MTHHFNDDAAPPTRQGGEAIDRGHLGKLVREEWVAWAHEQTSPKASWLVSWEGLSEPDREVDRRIGERLYREGAAAAETRAAALEAALRALVAHGPNTEDEYGRQCWYCGGNRRLLTGATTPHVAACAWVQANALLDGQGAAHQEG